MKTLQAYLAGTLLVAAMLGSASGFAQEDTTRPNRKEMHQRDSSMRNWDKNRDTSMRNWDRNRDTMRNWNRKHDSSMRSMDRNNARSNEMAHSYIDLNSGNTLDYWYDTDKKMVMDRTTNMPVDFYVNTMTGDTVYGRGRFVVNGLLLKGEDGKWKFDESKVKMDKDELKIKDGSRKLKIDGDEIKVKDGRYKMKADDKEAKIKDRDSGTKAKVTDKEMKVKDQDGKARYKDDKTKIKDKRTDSTRIEQQQ